MTEKLLEAETLLQNRYRIGRKIGQGGMGAVYLAKDERFGSVVAIKETLFGDENYRKALEREARLLNSLRHPALPVVSDYFVEGKGQYIVMEYISGEDLAEQLAKNGKPFPLDDVLKWSNQLLDALDFLHNQTIPVIHRDIKPQNIKLTKRSQIILLDFGLAKGNPTDVSHLTAAKSIFGYSPGYASLEQIQGTGTEPRSDLYSLAATLYHLLTGVPPADALTRAMSVLNEQDDPLKPANLVNREIPSGIANILQKAMALNAGHRPESAKLMREMLADSASFDELNTIETPTGKAMPTNIFNQETKLFNSENARQSSMETVVLNEDEDQPEISRVTKVVNRDLRTTQPGNFKGKYTVGAAVFGVLLLVGIGIFALQAISDHAEPNIEVPVSDKNTSETKLPEVGIVENTEMQNPANEEAGKVTDRNTETSDVSAQKEKEKPENPVKKSTENKKETAKTASNEADSAQPMIFYDPEVGNVKVYDDKIVTDEVTIESNRMIIREPGKRVKIVPINPDNLRGLTRQQRRALNQRIFEQKMKDLQKNSPKPPSTRVKPPPPPPPTPEN